MTLNTPPDTRGEGESTWSIDLAHLPALVLRWSLILTAFLTVLHVLSTDFFVNDLLRVGAGSDGERARSLFRLQQEQSLPTWYSVVLLLGCGVVLLTISEWEMSRRGPRRTAWLVLGLIFVAMSIDEQVGFHETTGAYLGTVVETGGFLQFAWVIPGSIFAAVVGLNYWRSFRSLPRLYLALFFGAGAIYVSGALFAEMLEGFLVSKGYQTQVGWSNLLQDPLEMAGAAVFLYALLRYGVEQLGWRRLTLGAGSVS